MIITVEQIEVLRPYIENIEELISADDVDALLDAVDDAVVDNIVAHNDEPDMMPTIYRVLVRTKQSIRMRGQYFHVSAICNRICFSIPAIDSLAKHELPREESSDTFQRNVKMTKEEFYAKRLELLMQSIDAEQAIIRCAKRHGTWKMGLDSNRALFKTLEKAYRGKIAELERQARTEGVLPESEKSK